MPPSIRHPQLHRNLTRARKAKNDEFYTQMHDIEVEISAYTAYCPDVFRDKTVLLPCDDPSRSNFTRFFAQNFETLGLRRLISTSYAPAAKKCGGQFCGDFFEQSSPQFDKTAEPTHGKIYILDHDVTGDGKIDLDDLQWQYLQGDGDFRSAEVRRLRDEADIIVTNPPFSLFREFLAWIMEAGKRFLIIGNMNAITYKEVFTHIKDNKVWLGRTNFNTGMYFFVPEGFKYKDSYHFIREMEGRNVNRVPGVCWFTNLEHGRRHQPLELMSMADNLRFSRYLRGRDSYEHYDNYDAIECPATLAIPNDYSGVMGVPISFLDKYCPEQFEILGIDRYIKDNPRPNHRFTIRGKEIYARLLIRAKSL